MTEQRMRELLHEVADVVPPPNVAGAAWRRSVRVRHLRRVGAAVLAAGSVVAVIGVVGFVTNGVGDGRDGSAGPSPVAPPAPPEAASPREPFTRVDHADAWLGPKVAEESRLPRRGSLPLPGTIDLTSVATTDPKPGPAVAAFAAADDPTPTSILLLGYDGRVSRLGLPDLEPVFTREGNPLPLLNLGSLSPDGTRLVFPQPHGIVTYELANGDDQSCTVVGDVPTFFVGWSADGTQVTLPEDSINPDSCVVTPGQSGGDSSADSEYERIGQFVVEQPYFPMRSLGDRAAEAAWNLRADGLPAELAEEELIVVDGPRPALLAVPEDADERGVAPGVRVVSWLDHRTVAFESQATGQFNILGWDIKNGAVSLVSEIAVPDGWDDGVIASWTDLNGESG
jgi:hypothetical protein